MDTKEFIASLASSLAWPCAVVVVALMLRAELKDLMQRPLSNLAVGPLKLEWPEAAEWTREAVEGIPNEDVSIQEVPHPDLPEAPEEEFTAALRPLVDLAPAEAIKAAYAMLGRELRSRLIALGQPAELTSKFDTRDLAIYARNYKLISAKTLEAIKGLDTLRNLAAHGDGTRTTPAEASEFVDLVEALLFALATQNPDNIT